MGQVWLAIGALSAGIGVVLGAFGAHALKARLGEAALQTWQTAVTYQFIHALALLVVGLLLRSPFSGSGNERLLNAAGAAFVVGLLFFSGSLYGLVLGGPRWLGPITPLGGVAFILGWATLAFAVIRPLSVQ